MEDTAAHAAAPPHPAGEVGSVFHATNGDVENTPVTIEIVTERARDPAGHRPHRARTTTAASRSSGPSHRAPGERAYWGVSHGRADRRTSTGTSATGKHFWIDATVGLETLRIIDAVYEQSPGLRP